MILERINFPQRTTYRRAPLELQARNVVTAFDDDGIVVTCELERGNENTINNEGDDDKNYVNANDNFNDDDDDFDNDTAAVALTLSWQAS